MTTQNHWGLWNQALATIIEDGFDDKALVSLIAVLERIVQGSSSTIVVYPPQQRPSVHYQKLLDGEDPATHIDQYLAGAYLVDPYYVALQEQGADGVFTIRDVAPDGFEESEYYKVYYHAVDLLDEACFILQGIQGNGVIISLGRHTKDNYFNPDEKALLASLFPVVKSIVKTTIKNWAKGSAYVQQEHIVKTHLDAALKNFGASQLTQRECQIVNQILRGNSIKSISQRLGNSVETIKHHRKNIYAKLSVNSQAELFYLFIDSLRSCPPEINKDPLIAYMTRKQ